LAVATGDVATFNDAVGVASNDNYWRNIYFMSTIEPDLVKAAVQFTKADDNVQLALNSNGPEQNLGEYAAALEPLVDTLRRAATDRNLAAQRYILGGYWAEPDLLVLKRLVDSMSETTDPERPPTSPAP
jgi:hypothetical protein